MMLMSRLVVGGAAALTLGGVANASTITNGTFSGGLSGWSSIGVAAAGPNLANIGGFGTGDYAIVSTGTGNGLSGLGTPQTDAMIETAVGLASGTLDALAATLGGANDATEGSAIWQSVSVNAGDTLSFDWQFLTDEFTPQLTYNDFSWYAITDSTGAVLVADTFSSSFSASSSDFDEETSQGSETVSFGTAGVYNIVFGVVDNEDTIVDSALIIDNVTIQAIPLPPAAFMALAGLGGVVVMRRRHAG